MEERWKQSFDLLSLGTFPDGFDKSQKLNLRRYTSKFKLKASGWPPRPARLSKTGRLRRRKRRIWVDAHRNGDIPGPETRGCLTMGLMRGGVQSRVMGSICCLRKDTQKCLSGGITSPGWTGRGWRSKGGVNRAAGCCRA
ncbi:unnamed protein product [Boreogadus saida]